MKYFSTFSGIGGFELGIKQAYENLSITSRRKQRGAKKNSTNNEFKQLATQQPTCVGYSEIDRYAIQVYQKHFNHKNYGDITKIITDKLPNFDLLVGGFPCQAFSIAGRRKGFDDTRGTLFFDLARILRDKRPRYFVFENVKGLLSHDSIKTFQTILGVLTDLGYRIEWQVLNSKNFGVPQNRERVFIVGHLREKGRRKVFPIGEDDGESFEKYNIRKKETREIAQTIVATYWKGGKGSHIKIDKKGKPKKDQNNASCLTGGGHSGGNHSDMDLIKNDLKIRRLTPIECERLQGFPDDWTAEGIIDAPFHTVGRGITQNYKIVKISDTQRYKMCGNAVTVNVVEEIIINLTNN